MSEHRKATQCNGILQYMKDHGRITPKEALQHFKCMRLASRINDLKRFGNKIGGEIETSKDENGQPVRYKRYWVEE